eukprot:6635180-Prymnesium_polylepis.1
MDPCTDQALYQPEHWTRYSNSTNATLSKSWACVGDAEATCHFAKGTAWEQGAFTNYLLHNSKTN